MVQNPFDYDVGELFSSEGRDCKLKVIQEVDNPAIEKFAIDNFGDKRSLTYFGLSGASLTDFVNWREYIQKGVSVEVFTNVYHQQIRSMFSKRLVSQFDVSSDVLVIQSDIDRLLDQSEDCSLGANPLFDPFLPFTLINLDYYGTVIGASATGIMKRIELLKHLFKMQWERNNQIKYLVLLTIYHAGKDSAPETEESQLKSKIHEFDSKYKKISDRVLKTGKRIPILSLGVPLFIAEAAKTNHTYLRTLERVTYRDSSYTMLHFIFELQCQKRQSPEIAKKNIFKEAPLKVAKKKSNGRVMISKYWND